VGGGSSQGRIRRPAILQAGHVYYLASQVGRLPRELQALTGKTGTTVTLKPHSARLS